MSPGGHWWSSTAPRLGAAARAVFGHPIIARCKADKARNANARLSKGLADTAASKMHVAYRLDSALAVQAAPADLARQFDKTHAGAVASLREGLEETLTVTGLGVSPTLARTLRSTSPIESVIEICRDHGART
jgi:putative transposase